MSIAKIVAELVKRDEDGLAEELLKADYGEEAEKKAEKIHKLLRDATIRLKRAAREAEDFEHYEKDWAKGRLKDVQRLLLTVDAFFVRVAEGKR